MDERALNAIRERWAKREGDPRFTYQSGCAGSHARNGAMHRGPCGEGLHHHHDDRCAPSPSEDLRTLLAEVERQGRELKHAEELREICHNEHVERGILRLMGEIREGVGR